MSFGGDFMVVLTGANQDGYLNSRKNSVHKKQDRVHGREESICLAADDSTSGDSVALACRPHGHHPD